MRVNVRSVEGISAHDMLGTGSYRFKEWIPWFGSELSETQGSSPGSILLESRRPKGWVDPAVETEGLVQRLLI